MRRAFRHDWAKCGANGGKSTFDGTHRVRRWAITAPGRVKSSTGLKTRSVWSIVGSRTSRRRPCDLSTPEPEMCGSRAGSRHQSPSQANAHCESDRASPSATPAPGPTSSSAPTLGRCSLPPAVQRPAVLVSRRSGFPPFGVPQFRFPAVQVSRSSGVPQFRFSAFQVSRLKSVAHMRISRTPVPPSRTSGTKPRGTL
jgi:hypothetical protein